MCIAAKKENLINVITIIAIAEVAIATLKNAITLTIRGRIKNAATNKVIYYYYNNN